MDTVLSIVVLAAIALVGGGLYLLRKGEKKQGGLMLLVALVMIGNVIVWTIPVPEAADGAPPAAAD